MPSSTSSSSSHARDRVPPGAWGLTWIVAVILASFALAETELSWRDHGHRPSLVDDPALWAYHRGRVYGKGGRTVVLVGDSRMLVGFHLPTFRERFPDYRIVQLAINGSAPVDTLEDLANDERFRGIVICALMPSHFNPNARGSQKEYIDYYHTHGSWNTHLNLLARLLVQDNLVVTNPQVGLKTTWRGLLCQQHLPVVSNRETHFDRSRYVDFRHKNLDALRRQRQRSAMGTGSMPRPDEWLRHARTVDGMARRIQRRGGEVVFVAFPTSGGVQEALERRYPKRLFWDRFAAETRAETIHFKQVRAMSDFECPDWSHLDCRDVPRFTSALLDELECNRVLRKSGVSHSGSTAKEALCWHFPENAR